MALKKEVLFTVHNIWILVATCLVYVMHLGFACIESGFSQRKNVINVLFKNVSVVTIGLLSYAMIGFSLMYPGEDFAGGYFGFAGFGIGTDESGMTPSYNEAYTYWTDFIFQAMFAATAATIVSGAVAERIKLESFLIFAFLLVAFVYPMIGMWKWGGGFLDTMETPFYDFAGSSLVHSVGGWSALASVMLLGARIGKYDNGKVNTIYPHSLPLATIGALMLWFGWYGFNGGSVLSADPGAVSLVFVTTSLGAAAGIAGAVLGALTIMKQADLGMALNGCLAGLVGITAGADQFSPLDAILVGMIGGYICVVSVLFFDRMKLDDPVGAISVHLVGGVWGTLAVGIFGNLASLAQLMSQLKGVLCIGIAAFVASFAIMAALKAALGIRVSEEDEIEGLDLSEHGASAYRGLHLAVNREMKESKNGK
ncbi:MAG: ammonium transporter [Zetaproteobacteria bacterium]|nr:ammonium transporter [Zetaproteobacteria bacterium]